MSRNALLLSSSCRLPSRDRLGDIAMAPIQLAHTVELACPVIGRMQHTPTEIGRLSVTVGLVVPEPLRNQRPAGVAIRGSGTIAHETQGGSASVLLKLHAGGGRGGTSMPATCATSGALIGSGAAWGT